MRRRLFSLAAGISLLVMIATLVLWGPSFAYYDDFLVNSGWAYLSAHSINGRVTLIVGTNNPSSRRWFAEHQSIRNTSMEWTDPSENSRWHGLGFGFDAYTEMYATGPMRFVVLVLPHWFVALVAGILPASWLWRRKKATGERGFAVETAGETTKAL